MPEPPDVGLFTHYVLENPWPIGLLLLLIGLWLAWSGLREALPQRLRSGGIVGAVGAAVLLAGYLITTPGEHAKAITRQLVAAVVNGDAQVSTRLVSDDAVFAIGSPKNPGFGEGIVKQRLIDFADRYLIESNTITLLKGYGESADSAQAYLGCLTTVDGIPTASQWVLQVRRQGDGSWKVTRLTCVTINNQSPPSDVMTR